MLQTKMNTWILLATCLYINLLLPSIPTAQGQDSSSNCQFPFIYRNVTYTTCTTEGDPDGKFWCSTRTDSLNNHISNGGHFKHCETAEPKNTVCSGDCIKIDQCPSLNSLLQQYRQDQDPNKLSKIRKSICAKDGPTLLVCCPRTSDKISQLSEACGLSGTNDKIVGGENAELGSWPWMVIFRSREIQNIGGQTATGLAIWTCGGVLITEQYVLSAAHCFPDNIKVDFARIGEFDLGKDPDKKGHITAPQPQDISVEYATRHPQYRKHCQRQRCNDIAIVKLSRPATLGVFVQPICLPANPEQELGYSVSEFQSKTAFTTGWGVSNSDDIFTTSSGSGILQQAKMTIQELNFCKERKLKYPDRRMILCAGQGDGKDVCRGDSGGPLMLNDRGGLRWYVVGITSFGAAICGDPSAQAIFTSVHYYMDWINQNIL